MVKGIIAFIVGLIIYITTAHTTYDNPDAVNPLNPVGLIMMIIGLVMIVINLATLIKMGYFKKDTSPKITDSKGKIRWASNEELKEIKERFSNNRMIKELHTAVNGEACNSYFNIYKDHIETYAGDFKYSDYHLDSLDLADQRQLAFLFTTWYDPTIYDWEMSLKKTHTPVISRETHYYETPGGHLGSSSRYIGGDEIIDGFNVTPYYKDINKRHLQPWNNMQYPHMKDQTLEKW